MGVKRIKSKMNEKELVDAFLLRSHDVIAEIHRRTMGEDSLFPEASPALLMKFFDLFVDLVKRSDYIGEVRKLNAATAADIIGMLRDGQVSIKDALDLMHLIQMDFEMAELRTLSDKLEAIQNPSSPNLSSVG